MPKPRAKQLSAAEQEIIGRGGEPGASALVEPVRKEPAVQPVAAPAPAAPELRSKRPALIQAMARFTPDEMSEIEASIQRFAEREGVKISLNKWIVRACMEYARRDR
jgi:hypothetical protein